MLPGPEAENHLRASVVRHVAQFIGLPETEIRLDHSFIDLGVTSAEAVYLCGAMEEQFGMPVDPVLIFEAESLEAFAKLLLASVTLGPDQRS